MHHINFDFSTGTAYIQQDMLHQPLHFMRLVLLAGSPSTNILMHWLSAHVPSPYAEVLTANGAITNLFEIDSYLASLQSLMHQAADPRIKVNVTATKVIIQSSFLSDLSVNCLCQFKKNDFFTYCHIRDMLYHPAKHN